MRLKLFTIVSNKFSTPPSREGWHRQWHGYHQMKKVRSNRKINQNKKKYANVPEHVLRESLIERQIFLNIIHDIKKKNINMIELGAGRGDWCLALAGIIDHQLIPCLASTYRCLGLEAEPTHYEWTKEHFEKQQINAIAVHGASGGVDGYCNFYSMADPADNYGQHINEEKGNLKVPLFKLATLLKKYDFSHVDLLHMDIQGVETETISSAKDILKEEIIDYIMIGTHRSEETNKELKNILTGYYDILLDIPPKAGLVDTVFGKAFFPVDGMLVLKRSNL
jgi:FkbM family methyltransferase